MKHKIIGVEPGEQVPASIQGLQLDVVSALVADETDKPLAARQVGLALSVTHGDLRSARSQIALELGKCLPHQGRVFRRLQDLLAGAYR